MKYGKHATERMQERGICRADAGAVVANPIKTAPGQSGATNFWGFDSKGFRIRVTVMGDGVTVKRLRNETTDQGDRGSRNGSGLRSLLSS